MCIHYFKIPKLYNTINYEFSKITLYKTINYCLHYSGVVNTYKS